MSEVLEGLECEVREAIVIITGEINFTIDNKKDPREILKRHKAFKALRSKGRLVCIVRWQKRTLLDGRVFFDYQALHGFFPRQHRKRKWYRFKPIFQPPISEWIKA